MGCVTCSTYCWLNSREIQNGGRGQVLDVLCGIVFCQINSYESGNCEWPKKVLPRHCICYNSHILINWI